MESLNKEICMTLKEFDELLEDNSVTYELIEGELVMHARPAIKHQRIMSRLTVQIGSALKKSQCDIFTETELEIEGNVLVPDISVLCNVSEKAVQRFKEPPALVIEILSPANTVVETNKRIEKYESHGIPEIWVVDPENKSITKYMNGDSVHITYIKSGSIKSDAIDNVEINLSDLFD